MRPEWSVQSAKRHEEMFWDDRDISCNVWCGNYFKNVYIFKFILFFKLFPQYKFFFYDTAW